MIHSHLAFLESEALPQYAPIYQFTLINSHTYTINDFTSNDGGYIVDDSTLEEFRFDFVRRFEVSLWLKVSARLIFRMEVTSTIISVQTQASTLVTTITYAAGGGTGATTTFGPAHPTGSRTLVSVDLPDFSTTRPQVPPTLLFPLVETVETVIQVPVTLTTVVTFTSSTGLASLARDGFKGLPSENTNSPPDHHLSRIIPAVLIPLFFLLALVSLFLYRRRSLYQRQLAKSKPEPFIPSSGTSIPSLDQYGGGNQPSVQATRVVRARKGSGQPTMCQVDSRLANFPPASSDDVRIIGNPSIGSLNPSQPHDRATGSAQDVVPITQVDIHHLQARVADIEAGRHHVIPPPEYSPDHDLDGPTVSLVATRPRMRNS
ncbi:hypothetical protein D9756_007984 [Leucocoprinus leucothites]|uniref:Uncharacterized protein n=1 Tax=Leucocoprinus leucothites TaxID=201217 RepID=A0A8H5D472_9AGAR|nr:hypothetical protein D9756_007984 [Leucoagaricus leucothites]